MFECAFGLVATEDIGALWFFSALRTQDTKALFAIGIKLYSLFKGERYLFWAIISLQLQTNSANRIEAASIAASGDEGSGAEGGGAALESSAASAPIKLSEKLAERMLMKAFEPEKIAQRTFEELLLFITATEGTGNHEAALKLLSSAPGIEFPNEDERIILRGDLLEKCGHLQEAIELMEGCLTEKGIFDWSAWKLYVKAIDKSPNKAAYLDTLPVIMERIGERSDQRSALLARIDAAILWSFPSRASSDAEDADGASRELRDHIVNYVEAMQDKGCCIPDMQHVALSLPVSVLRLLMAHCKERPIKDGSLLGKNLIWARLLRVFSVKAEAPILLSDGEREEGSLDGVHCEMIASVRNALSELGPKASTSGEATLLALGHMHLATLFADQGTFDSKLQAASAIRTALSYAPDDFSLKLFLILVYVSLGSASLALQVFRSLDIKQLQLDTLSYMISDHIVELGDTTDSEHFFHDSFYIYDDNRTQSWGFIAQALSRASYSNVAEFYEFARRLEYSLQAVACICGTIRTELLCKPFEVVSSYVQGLIPEELFFDDNFMANLSDNRDRDVLDFVDHSGRSQRQLMSGWGTFGRTSILILTFIPLLLRSLVMNDADQLRTLVEKTASSLVKVRGLAASLSEGHHLSLLQLLLDGSSAYLSSGLDAAVLISALSAIVDAVSASEEADRVVEGSLYRTIEEASIDHLSYERIALLFWPIEEGRWIALILASLASGVSPKMRKEVKELAAPLEAKLAVNVDRRSALLSKIEGLLGNLGRPACITDGEGALWGDLMGSWKSSIASFGLICKESRLLLG